MVWIMRGLVAIALALGLVIVFVLLIGNIGSRDDATETTALTVGNRTVTVAGHYMNLSQETVSDGVKIIVEGHEIMVTADQLSVDGKAQVLEPEDNVTIYVTKDGTAQVRVTPAK
ncbi:MAG: hypothetical protein KDJ72_12585 [Methyloceanibacter sp.]|nr:hypothetical protein [Methyloceanibacter sp.]